MKYFVYYYHDFGNTYNLYYTETSEQESFLPDGSKQITRKEAENLCVQENYRRKHDQSSAYRADNLIYPAGWEDNGDEPICNGYIVIGHQ